MAANMVQTSSMMCGARQARPSALPSCDEIMQPPIHRLRAAGLGDALVEAFFAFAPAGKTAAGFAFAENSCHDLPGRAD